MIKSLFFDIDGTLVSFETHQIPRSTIDALEKAKAQGISIYISTGRPISIITNLGDIKHLIDGYITTNGAYCFVGHDVVRCCPISPADVAALLRDAVRHDYSCLIVGDRNVALLNRQEIFDEVFLRTLAVKGIDLDLPVSRVIGSLGNGILPDYHSDREPQDILQMSPFFDERHEKDIMRRLDQCQSGRWHPAFTDITSVNADKGKGLKAMARHLGIRMEETMAFGDGGNDIAIIQTAGTGVAMGNACDALKEQADFVTDDVDHDGIAKALEHFHVI